MILIADSGSTKTEWCVSQDGIPVRQIRTNGTNPFFQSACEIAGELEQALFPAISDLPIDAVCFYGAGCAFPEKNKIIADCIQARLPVPVEVYSDLVGAARALLGHKAGIACILGTGSNSCLYDGEKIVQQTPALGYILGDEGSGAVLGKLLVGDCLKKQWPQSLIDSFLDRYQLTQASILERVYKQPFPNRFLASLVPFLHDHLNEEPVYRLVYNSFSQFFIRNILSYPNASQYPIGCTGSVAWYFRDVLQDAAHSQGLHLGEIRQAPMEGLITYHSTIY